jgi:hypothetical protein
MNRALLVIALFGSGCATLHPQLTAPPADAPLDDRAAAYDALRPAPAIELRGLERPSTPELVLNDGTRVVDARDLEPVVASDSATTAHAEHAAELANSATWWTSAGGLVVLAGAVGLAAWTAETSTLQKAFDPQNLEWFGAGIGVVGAGAVLGVVGGVQRVEADEESEAAFRSYNRDLRARLALTTKQSRVAAK